MWGWHHRYCCEMDPLRWHGMCHIQTMRVLICDDEPLIAATLADHLDMCGYQTSIYHRVRDLLIELETDVAGIGLILTDLCMPDRDGMRLADTVRRLGLDIPVALMSSHALPLSHDELHERGVSILLRKPLHMHEVEAVAASARTAHAMKAAP